VNRKTVENSEIGNPENPSLEKQAVDEQMDGDFL
jgi:hypothetical protein